ncbi:hypothetical protein T440DRAFT_531117 [Plenodomus tracheiphilus IPT5]|uniref:Uncharacterized protein n=1 Tax=Plenodomus tracheiphilus IPT5 TaxID=1408161 RepID=A0A6A7BPD0_9PLEO|nr:hypothetical protein T440DRAFT_531117 [Plenodomus tracheiphilus IPT5]
MDQQHDTPNTGYVQDISGDAAYDSDDANQDHDNRSDISPGQSPHGGPSSFEFPQPSARRKILSEIFECAEDDPPHQPQAHTSRATASRPVFPVYLAREFDESENESEIQYATDDDADPPRPSRPTQTRTNTSTFDAPTKSSMAKQNGKVELPNTISRNSTTSRNQSTRLGSVHRQRPLFAEDHGGPIHFGPTYPINTSRLAYRRAPRGQSNDYIQHPSSPAATAKRFGHHRRQRSRSVDQYHRFKNMQKRSSLSGIQHSETPNDLLDQLWESQAQDLLVPYRPLSESTAVGCNDETEEPQTPESETSLGDTASIHDVEEVIEAVRPVEHNFRVQELEDHIVVKREVFISLKTELDAEQKLRKRAQRDLQAVRENYDNVEGDLQAVLDKYDQLQEHTDSVQNSKVEAHQLLQDLLVDNSHSRQKIQILEYKLQEMENRMDTCYLETRAPATLEAALEEIKLLRVAAKDGKKAEQESEDANAEAERMYDELEKLQNDINIMNECVKDKIRMSPDSGTTQLDSVRSIIQGQDSASVAQDHAFSLLQFFDTYENAIEELEETNNQLQKDLTKEKRRSTYLDSKKTSTNSELSLTFQTLYEQEKKKREILEAEFQKVQEATATSMDHALGTENAKLKDGLAKYHRRTLIPRLQAGFYQARARQWKHEAKTAQEELNRRIHAFETQQNAQTIEMQLYIQEYHNKTNDKSHWNLRDLQQKIATLERDIHQTTILFTKTKSEKANLETEIARLMADNDEKDRLINEKLMYVGADLASPLPPPSSSLSSSLSSSSSVLHPTDNASPQTPTSHWLATRDFTKTTHRHPPRFILKQEQYKATMTRFRQAQEKRRVEEEDAFDELMEKLRRYRMGVMGVKYPPSKGVRWETLREESLWERWGGEGWRGEVKLSLGEERLVGGLRGKDV